MKKHEKIIKTTFDGVIHSKDDLSVSSLVDTGLSLLLYQPAEDTDCVLSISIYKSGKKGTYLHPDNFRKLMNHIEQEVLSVSQCGGEPFGMPSRFYQEYTGYHRVIKRLKAHRITIINKDTAPLILHMLSSKPFKEFAKLCGVYDIAILTKTVQQDTSTFIN